MTNNIVNIKVIAGSTRDGRFSDKAAKWISEEIIKYEEVSVEILDLRDYKMPFFDQAISPKFKQEPYENEAVARFTRKIDKADAFIIVTPEYNHGTSAVLKNAMDWVYHEWNNKPVGFVSYGAVGGARAIEQLRLMAVELQMAPIQEAIHINGEQFFPVVMSGGNANDLFSNYIDKAQSMISQLLWWTIVLKNARSNK